MEVALIGILLVGLYFMPSIVAWSRYHHSSLAIFAFNLFLGWTFLGWVLALVWSLAYVVPRPEVVRTTSGSPAPALIGIGAVALVVIAFQFAGKPAPPSQPRVTYDRTVAASAPLETASISPTPVVKIADPEKVKREAERAQWCRAEIKKAVEQRSAKVTQACARELRTVNSTNRK